MIRATSRWLFWSGLLFTASLRLAHVNLLWSDEDYHLAAALQLVHGRMPYRDFWYDKPPLAALFYSLIGGYAGWPLRFLDIAFVLACCWVAYKLAKAWWGEAEGLTAALLLAFFTTFYLPAATIPFAVDGLLLLPHLAAIYFAKQRKPFLCGLCCAAGLLTNVKAIFIVATCALWLFPALAMFTAGTAFPLCLAASAAAALGIAPDFYRQVWQWGLLYAKGAAIPNPWSTGLKRTTDWLAFHGALLAGFIACARTSPKNDRFEIGTWFVLSAAALSLGNHFAPRYFFQLLPVMVIAGARGIVFYFHARPRLTANVLAVLLLIPFLRFGPRYADLILDNIQNRPPVWSDVALDLDSQQAANFINAHKHPGDTLFVWGYRPDLYVYTRLLPPEKFWDSQPLDGVPADRHLVSSDASLNVPARNNRSVLVNSKPAFIVDGLGPLNPALSPENFPDIAAWMRNYQLVVKTKLSKIYEARKP